MLSVKVDNTPNTTPTVANVSIVSESVTVLGYCLVIGIDLVEKIHTRAIPNSICNCNLRPRNGDKKLF